MKYEDGYKYRLKEDEFIKLDVFPLEDIKTEYIDLDTKGNMTIRHGYCWDGCSGPTKDTESNMTPGLMHDGCYQLMRMELLSQKWRKKVDMEFRKMCLDRGMWKIRAWYYYRAVRKFGLSSASAENRKKTLTAP